MSNRRIWVFVASAALVARAWGGEVASRDNSVSRMTMDADRKDWGRVEPFPADRVGEAAATDFEIDWRDVSIAHASGDGMLYVRYRLEHAADFVSYPAFYNIFFDTDGKRSTGYLGGSQQFSVGADYLLQGATVFKFSGSEQTDFMWEQLDAGTYQIGADGKDVVIAVPLSLIGKPESFDFIVYGDNALNQHTPDYYPDGADQGARGDYFHYDLNGKHKTGAARVGLKEGNKP